MIRKTYISNQQIYMQNVVNKKTNYIKYQQYKNMQQKIMSNIKKTKIVK